MFCTRSFIRLRSVVKAASLTPTPVFKQIFNRNSINNIPCLSQKWSQFAFVSKRSLVTADARETKPIGIPTSNIVKRVLRKKNTTDKPGVSIRFFGNQLAYLTTPFVDL